MHSESAVLFDPWRQILIVFHWLNIDKPTLHFKNQLKSDRNFYFAGCRLKRPVYLKSKKPKLLSSLRELKSPFFNLQPAKHTWLLESCYRLPVLEFSQRLPITDLLFDVWTTFFRSKTSKYRYLRKFPTHAKLQKSTRKSLKQKTTGRKITPWKLDLFSHCLHYARMGSLICYNFAKNHLNNFIFPLFQRHSFTCPLTIVITASHSHTSGPSGRSFSQLP